MSKKLTSIIAALALVLSLVGAQSAAALTAGDIAMLQAAGIISASQAATLSAGMTPSASTGGYSFTMDLTVGSKGADVSALQKALVNGGHLVMPAGVAMGYFGPLTKSSVIKYQLSKGITPAVGYFGPKTRASMSGSMTTGTTGTTVISGTDLSVSLSATSPLASALIAGQAAANLAEFTFANKSAAPAVVTNVTLQRLGVSADTSLTNVYLYNGATRLTDSASVSAGKISFNAASGIFTVPAGSSLTVSVRADIASDANGQLVAVALTGVTASLPVSAVYPVSGSSMSVFSSSDIAKATSTILSLGGSITAGSLNQTIWSSSVALAGRAVYLKSLALKVIGSIPSNSLQNVKLYVAGIQVAQSMGTDSNGMLTFDLSAAPYKMDSSRTIEVRADVVNGSSRTFNVTLQNASDMMLIDSNYNVGIAVAFGNTQSTATFSVSTGSITAQQDSSLVAGNIVTGSSNVALGRYTLKAYGEDMKVSYLQASSTDQLDNVALYANGVQIGSTRTISATSTPVLFSLGSSLIIPAGQTVTVEIRGDIKYNGTNATTTTNTIKVNLSGYANNAQGSYSAQLSTAPSTVGIDGPLMTVVGGGLTVAKNTAVSNTVAIPNTSGVKIGSYVLQANSSENVRVTNLTVTLGGSAASTSLSNLYVRADGVSATPQQIASSNNYSVDFTIPANTIKIVEVYVDVANTTGTATTTLSLNGYGTNSNVSISASAVVGQVVTIGAGSLATPTVANTSPDAQLAVGLTTAKIVDYNFVSTNGTSLISEMYFDVTGPITQLTVNDKVFPVVSGSSSALDLNKEITVGASGKDVTVKATFATIDPANGEASMQAASVKLTGFKYTAGNTSVSTTTLSISSNSMIVVAGKPVVTIASSGDHGAGTKNLGKITIAADTHDIRLLTLPLKFVATASPAASVTGLRVTINGGSVAAASSTIASTTVVAGQTSTTTVSFFSGNGYLIPANTSVTFDVLGEVTVADGGSIQTSIATSAAPFVWKDVEGNATTTGAFIYNFPVGSASVNF